MPKRTNDFQELFCLIQTALAQNGDKVTSPAMVRGQGLETEREIDILYETPTGLFTLKVAFEAKDEGRPMDLVAFESYCGKYRGEGRVAVDKLVIVSRHGFTEGVREKARLMNVPLFTLDEAREVDWAKLWPEEKSVEVARQLCAALAAVPEYEDESLRELLEGLYRIVDRVYEDRVDVVAVVHGARRKPRGL